MRQFIALVACLFGLWAVPAALATPQLQIVVQNPNFLTLAVDGNGVAYGEPAPVNGTYSYSLYRSTDEGQTWSHLYDFPSYSHLYNVSVLSDNTLIAHVDTGSMNLFRSGDGGTTWADVLTMPTSPVFYTTLTAHSVTDLVTNNNRYVFVGSYNSGDSTNHTNYIWRSADDGRTWSVIYTSTNHRHIHFVQADPYNGSVYVGYGDGGSQVSIERSTDQGATWTPICTGDACTAVDIAFDPAGFAIYGSDQPFADSYIYRMDVGTGALTPILKLPGPSYSDLRVSSSVWLVAETHEPGMTDDGDVHLFASDDGAHTFSEVLKEPYASAGSYARMIVQFAYPNGDFPIRIDGYGTMVGRIVSSGIAPDFSLTATPASQSVTAGASTTYNVSVTPAGGFSSDVALSANGLPAGASASFSPSTVHGSGTSTLTVASTNSTPAGTYTLTVTGLTSGGTMHTATVTYTVTAPAPDFSLSGSPSSRSVTAGTSTTFTATVAAQNGFAGNVALSASGLPSGTTASFSPASVAGAGTSTLTVSSSSSTPAGTYSVTLTGTSGGIVHSAMVTYTVTVAAVPDFGLSASPSSQSVIAGGSTSYTITVSAQNGFSGNVALSVTGLPAGAAGSFTPAAVTTSGTATLAVSSTSSTAPGTYALTITGTAGGITHSATVTYTVAAAVSPDFTISVGPSSRTMSRKGSAAYTISVAATGGFTGGVTLSVSGLPAGADATFSPASIDTSGTSKLTITANGAVARGRYTLGIVGVSGSTTRTAAATLVVN